MALQEYSPASREYQAERNRFIPFSERYANLAADQIPYRNEDAWKEAWNRFFHTKMNELWRNYVKNGGTKRNGR